MKIGFDWAMRAEELTLQINKLKGNFIVIKTENIISSYHLISEFIGRNFDEMLLSKKHNYTKNRVEHEFTSDELKYIEKVRIYYDRI